MQKDHSNSLKALIERHTPNEGENLSEIAGVKFYRVSQPAKRTPLLYSPCICFVAQGQKRAFLGQERYLYDELNYLVLSVPLPIEAEIEEASRDQPFLSIMMDIDSLAVGEILSELDSAGSSGSAQRGIAVSEMTTDLKSAVRRLMMAAADPQRRRVLGPIVKKEILFLVLQGEQGDFLRSVFAQDSRSKQIAEVIEYLQQNFAEPLTISRLAQEVGMSDSALHHGFKEVTSSSPMQYLKQLRLHKARLKMLHHGLNAGQAAYDVGYGSPSQFSREYKRLFGAPPRRDVAAARAQLQGTEDSAAV